MSTSKPAPLACTVVSADTSQPIRPGPLLADLLRTRFCVPGCVLLVEGIEADIPVSTQYRAVRLLLGDGELCVQALLRPEMHGCVDSGQVYVGCYVQLNRFELRNLPIKVAAGDAVDEMVLLVVRDMATVGWDTAYVQMAEPRGQQRIASDPAQPAKAIEALVASERQSNTTESCQTAELQQQQQQQRRLTGPRASSSSKKKPWMSDDLSQPLKLTPLDAIPKLPYKQNWVVNVLAVVASLSPVEPAPWPPYKQRIARLADPSTNKQVHLTVFLDPDEFAPQIGSVVLLLAVKNHVFDGGSLKKYENERPREGSVWWIENPRHLEWCNVDELLQWWLGRPS